MRVVVAGDAVIAPAATRRLIERLLDLSPSALGADTGTTPDVLAALAAREHEVLTLVARGVSNAEIAGRLYVSAGTVKTHVRRILGKLCLRGLGTGGGAGVRDRHGPVRPLAAVHSGQPLGSRPRASTHSTGGGRRGQALDELGHSRGEHPCVGLVTFQDVSSVKVAVKNQQLLGRGGPAV
jgi:hypothetical protein